MLNDSNAPRSLMRWDHSRNPRLGRDVITTNHHLAELPIFSDQGLACLIDRYPAEAMQVTTMGENPAHRSQLQYGQLGHYSGRAWVEMIRRGRLCLRLSNVAEHDKPLRDILRRLRDALRESQDGRRLHSLDGDLRIASPYVLEYLQVEIDPTVFWQIRGERNVLTYPLGAPVVPGCVLEELVANRDEQPLYFEPPFDEEATTHTLVPGDVIGLPQHAPFRVTCGGTLSISLATHYQTHESRRRNQVQRANRILGRWCSRSDDAITTTGPRALAKSFLARLSPHQTGGSEVAKPASFSVNPNADQCVGPIEDASEPSDRSRTTVQTIPVPVFLPGQSISALSAVPAKT